MPPGSHGHYTDTDLVTADTKRLLWWWHFFVGVMLNKVWGSGGLLVIVLIAMECCFETQRMLCCNYCEDVGASTTRCGAVVRFSDFPKTRTGEAMTSLLPSSFLPFIKMKHWFLFEMTIKDSKNNNELRMLQLQWSTILNMILTLFCCCLHCPELLLLLLMVSCGDCCCCY